MSPPTLSDKRYIFKFLLGYFISRQVCFRGVIVMHPMAALCTIYLHISAIFIVRIIKYPINIQLVKNKSDSLVVLHSVFKYWHLLFFSLIDFLRVLLSYVYVCDLGFIWCPLINGVPSSVPVVKALALASLTNFNSFHPVCFTSSLKFCDDWSWSSSSTFSAGSVYSGEFSLSCDL